MSPPSSERGLPGKTCLSSLVLENSLPVFTLISSPFAPFRAISRVNSKFANFSCSPSKFLAGQLNTLSEDYLFLCLRSTPSPHTQHTRPQRPKLGLSIPPPSVVTSTLTGQ